MGNAGCFTWVNPQQLQEQCYPFLPVCTVFLHGCQCLGFCDCRWRLYGHRKSVCRKHSCQCLGFCDCLWRLYGHRKRVCRKHIKCHSWSNRFLWPPLISGIRSADFSSNHVYDAIHGGHFGCKNTAQMVIPSYAQQPIWHWYRKEVCSEGVPSHQI